MFSDQMSDKWPSDLTKFKLEPLKTLKIFRHPNFTKIQNLIRTFFHSSDLGFPLHVTYHYVLPAFSEGISVK